MPLPRHPNPDDKPAAFVDYVERPAIIKPDGSVEFFTPELMELETNQLRVIANVAGGRLVWKKYELKYVEPETGFCLRKNCWALADKSRKDGECGLHS